MQIKNRAGENHVILKTEGQANAELSIEVCSKLKVF